MIKNVDFSNRTKKLNFRSCVSYTYKTSMCKTLNYLPLPLLQY